MSFLLLVEASFQLWRARLGAPDERQTRRYYYWRRFMPVMHLVAIEYELSHFTNRS